MIRRLGRSTGPGVGEPAEWAQRDDQIVWHVIGPASLEWASVEADLSGAVAALLCAVGALGNG